MPVLGVEIIKINWYNKTIYLPLPLGEVSKIFDF